MRFITAFLLALALPLAAQAVTIDLVPVGNPGNAPEVSGGGLFGRVTYAYQIGKTEVTNAQYAEFLNAKAADDGLQLFHTSMGFNSDGGIVRSGSPGSYTYAVKDTEMGVGPGGTDYTYGDKPVNYVSWFSAVRFANWMHNGQGSGGTEAGAYSLIGNTPIPTNPDSIVRSAGATWFLPTENEWYKAAYYDSATTSYFDYPTSSDTAPTNDLPTADTGNSADFLANNLPATGDLNYPLTSVGAYALSESPYGTRDQGGNLAEWNETLISTSRRGRRGGAWSTPVSDLASATRGSFIAGNLNSSTGFRLATVAAPVDVPGDYNGNGVVDAADYVVWRKHLGTMFQLQNEVAGTSPGNVDQDDYTAWRVRFGNTSGAGAGIETNTSAVPEPGTASLLLLAGLLLVAARSRRR